MRNLPVILLTRESINCSTVDADLSALNLSALTPAVETSTLALERGLLLADALWFHQSGVVEAELESGQFATLPLGATYLSGAVRMTRVAGQPIEPAMSRLMDLARPAAALGRDGAGRRFQ